MLRGPHRRLADAVAGQLAAWQTETAARRGPARSGGSLRAWLDAILLPDEVLRFPRKFSWQAETATTLRVTVIPHLTTHLGASRQQVGNRLAESFMFEIPGPGRDLFIRATSARRMI